MPQIGAYEVQEDGVERRYGGPNLGWQTPESYEKAEKEGKVERPWWWHVTPDGISNHFEFMHSQSQKTNERLGYQGPATIGNIPLPLSVVGDRVVAGNSTPAIDQMVYGGTAGVAMNLAELGAAAGQKLDKGLFTPVDPYSDPTMKALGEMDEAARDSANLEQQYDRPPNAAVFENLGGEISTSVVGGVAGAAAVPATAFTKAPWFARLSPGMQKTLRWMSGTTIESVISTTGTANQNLEGNLSNAITPDGPFSVQPQDDILSATVKSYIPNAALENTLAGLFDLGGRGLSYSYKNVAERIAQGRAISQINNARLWAENNGLELRPDPNIPKWEFPDAKGPADPAAPEVEVVVEALDQLDDEALKKLDAVEEPADSAPTNGTADADSAPTDGSSDADSGTTNGTPSPETAEAVDELLGVNSSGLDAIEETLQEQAYVPRVESSEQDVMVASDRLAEPTVPYAEQWEQLPTDRLLGLANPQTSPMLFKEVNQLTGKEYENFTRRDVLDGLKGLQAKGQTLVPNRLQGDVARVADIQVDPQRFQFKEGTNEAGEQLGNSLSGVERWNPDAEGEISVWEDPADGLTYVVNGHNRLAKAKQLGVPTMRVRQILASDAGQARALGAIENISQGGGTVFDAAKFIREAGIESPGALEASGIPIQSGTGAQGLALSRLPDSLFQEAVNGELGVNRAAKLGGSGLDEETMIRVARMGDNMSERGFAELVDMAGTAPQVESDQMGLFGAEMMDTITIKAELAAKVKTLLTQNKNLMAKVSKKQAAEQLAGVGTNVNVSAAQLRADLVRGLVEQFDADKYMTGTPISELLNRGTEDIANGGKAATIAKRVAKQLSEASEEAPPPPKAADSDTTNGLNEAQIARLEAMSPEELMVERANAQKKLLGDRAKANREAQVEANNELADQVADFITNPDAYPEGSEPMLPSAAEFDRPGKQLANDAYARQVIEWIDAKADAPLTAAERNNTKKRIVQKLIDNGEVRPSETPIPDLPEPPSDLNNQQQLLADELRLAGEYQQQQAKNDFAARQAKRDAIGYDDMPLEEKKANGMLDGLDEPKAPLSERFADLMGKMAKTDADLFRTIGEQNAATREFVDFVLPPEVSKSAPRFGSVRLKFQSDLDKAAYIIRDKTKKSKGEPRIVKALVEQGFAVGEIQALGNDIKGMIQDAVEAQTGSRRAPQGLDIEIEVPASRRDPETLQPTEEGNARLQFEDEVKAAMKPFSDKTPRHRIEIAAESYASWTGTDIDTARYEVNYARKILDPDRVPSLDMDTARNDASMGRTTPATERVADAYRVAYKGRGSNVDYSIETERWAWIDEGKTFKYQKDLLKKDIEDAVRRVAGAKNVEFIGGESIGNLGKSWGAKPGTKGTILGSYNLMEDLITISGFNDRPSARVLSTAYHEAFHRLQYKVLSEKDMNILDSAWGRAKVSDFDSDGPKVYLESQAVAFQRYAEMRAKGWTAREQLMQNTLDHLDEEFPLKGGRSWHESIRGKAIDVLDRLFTAIWDTIDRLNNLARGNGYRTVYDLFDDAYDGELLKRRKNIEHENLLAEMAEKRVSDGLNLSDDEVESIVRYLERFDRAQDWRRVGSVLDKHKWHFQNEIDALKKKAVTEGC